jgi:hypothetical protein
MGASTRMTALAAPAPHEPNRLLAPLTKGWGVYHERATHHTVGWIGTWGTFYLWLNSECLRALEGPPYRYLVRARPRLKKVVICSRHPRKSHSRGSWAMNIAVHPRCKRCRRIMTSVAEIAPIGNDAGLLVLICAGCGTADSVFIYPKQKEPRSVAASG